MAVKVNARNLGLVPVLVTLGPCTMYTLTLVNNTGMDAWVQLFDTATPGSVTPSITAPAYTRKIAAGQMADIPLPPQGVLYSQGITAISTTADMGNVGSTLGVHLYTSV